MEGKGVALRVPRPQDYALETGGQYRSIFQAADFARHATSIGSDQASVSSLTLRLRQWLGIRDEVHGDHGAYLQLEYGSLELGSEQEFPKDDPELELRRGYLWLRPEPELLVRLGVVDWQDRFGGRPAFGAPYEAIDAYDSERAVLANSVWDFNVGGVVVEGRAGDATHYRAAVVLLGPGDATVGGEGTAALWAVDLDQEVDRQLFGASCYFLQDDADYSHGSFGPAAGSDSSWDLWVGGRAHLDLDGLKPSMFAILNHGRADDPDWRHTGVAAKAALEMALGEGSLSLQSLYSSGDDRDDPSSSHEFRTIAQSERDDLGAQGYWSQLAITSPRGPTDNLDLGVGLQNRGLGLFTVQAAWDVPLAQTLRGNFAAGWLQSAVDSAAVSGTDLGFEVAGQVRWAAARSTAVEAGAAWLATGDFYRVPGGPSPEDLFTVFVRVQMEF